MKHAILASLALILGTILGGISQLYASFRKGSGLAGAIKAEIVSLIMLVKAREYSSLESYANSFEAGILQTPPYVRVQRSYLGIYEAAMSKIGLLGASGSPTVEAYACANAFLEDLTMLSDIADEIPAKKSLFSAAFFGWQGMNRTLDTKIFSSLDSRPWM